MDVELTQIIYDKCPNDSPYRSIGTTRPCDEAQNIFDVGLKVIFIIARREIAIVGRQGVLSRDLPIARDGTHFTATNNIVKLLKVGFVVVVFRIEIEVLPLMAARITQWVG